MANNKEIKMKKGIGYIFLAGILCGMVGYFAAKYYTAEQARSELEALNLVVSVEDFVSRIKFHDESGITMKDADMFFYDLVEAKAANVYMFSAREFYSRNAHDQKELAGAINFLRGAKRLRGISISRETVAPIMKIHNALHSWDGDHENTFAKIKKSLEEKLKRSRISPEEIDSLRYIYTLEGNYSIAEKMSKKICQQNAKKCGLTEDVLVQGVIKDSQGHPLEKVTIMALNYPSQKKAITQADGSFELRLKANALDKIRLRAVKRGYSDGFREFYVYHPEGVEFDEKPMKKETNFVLNKSHAVVILDLDNQVLSFRKKGIIKSANFKDNQFHIRTNYNAYHIPTNSFVDATGKGVTHGKVELHLYEFDRSSEDDIEDLVLLDVSSENGERMFFGGFLLTFGMPYMQFYTESGEEIFVEKSNPINLTYQISEMDAMKTRERDPVTDEDLEQLVKYSQELGGYPLSREFLIEKDLFNMPPWWMLNRKKGMWENVPFRLINKEGLMESVFYSYGS